MRRPGFEPGHAAWKAAVIAIRPPAHSIEDLLRIYKTNDCYFFKAACRSQSI